MLRIVGFDPGSRACGFGAIEIGGSVLRSIEFGVWRLGAERLSRRLDDLFGRAEDLLARIRPDAVSIEIVVGGKSISSAVTLSEARGVLLLAAARARIPSFAYEPLSVKKAVTGYGRAEKVQVRDMIQRLLPRVGKGIPLDAADALAVAICHGHHATAPAFDARVAEC